MFNLRYHLASLAAVFVAIAVGIVIGVAIASGGGVEEATRALQDREIESLRGQLEAAQASADRSGRQQEAAAEIMADVYPSLMADRLAGKRVALLFVGAVDGSVRSAVQRTLADADAGSPARLTALELPIDVLTIDQLLGGDPTLLAYVGDDRLPDLGMGLARELATGGDTPLWDLLANQIVGERSGSFADPVDGVVIARSWWPEGEDDPDALQRNEQTEALLRGLLDELGRLPLPAIGVEISSTPESGVSLYRETGVSSVDDVDTMPGRLALALLLAGAAPGHYGIKDTADAISPPFVPVPVQPVETIAS